MHFLFFLRLFSLSSTTDTLKNTYCWHAAYKHDNLVNLQVINFDNVRQSNDGYSKVHNFSTVPSRPLWQINDSEEYHQIIALQL